MARDFVPGSSGVAAQLQPFVVPVLRKGREGRGTHLVGDASEIKSLGHPPRVGMYSVCTIAMDKCSVEGRSLSLFENHKRWASSVEED
jgi:hypothetical protein